MIKWEYKIVSYTGNIGEVKKDLDQLGHDGFELVAIYNGWMFVKRPKPKPELNLTYKYYYGDNEITQGQYEMLKSYGLDISVKKKGA